MYISDTLIIFQTLAYTGTTLYWYYSTTVCIHRYSTSETSISFQLSTPNLYQAVVAEGQVGQKASVLSVFGEGRQSFVKRRLIGVHLRSVVEAHIAAEKKSSEKVGRGERRGRKRTGGGGGKFFIQNRPAFLTGLLCIYPFIPTSPIASSRPVPL